MDQKGKALEGKKKDMRGSEEIESGVKAFEKRYREGKMKKAMPKYEEKYYAK